MEYSFFPSPKHIKFCDNMLGEATQYCQSEKTIVVAFFYDEGSWP